MGKIVYNSLDIAGVRGNKTAVLPGGPLTFVDTWQTAGFKRCKLPDITELLRRHRAGEFNKMMERQLYLRSGTLVVYGAPGEPFGEKIVQVETAARIGTCVAKSKETHKFTFDIGAIKHPNGTDLRRVRNCAFVMNPDDYQVEKTGTNEAKIIPLRFVLIPFPEHNGWCLPAEPELWIPSVPGNKNDPRFMRQALYARRKDEPAIALATCGGLDDFLFKYVTMRLNVGGKTVETVMEIGNGRVVVMEEKLSDLVMPLVECKDEEPKKGRTIITVPDITKNDLVTSLGLLIERLQRTLKINGEVSTLMDVVYACGASEEIGHIIGHTHIREDEKEIDPTVLKDFIEMLERWDAEESKTNAGEKANGKEMKVEITVPGFFAKNATDFLLAFFRNLREIGKPEGKTREEIRALAMLVLMEAEELLGIVKERGEENQDC
ncbi:MAG: hypothetical protein WC488_01940 [Candidatus Micrarchaeia archaeon]